ncbi:MAG: hypothetical protein CMO80_22935 [Verrucomicrobiales bacterium]|nr:hypothetical protein [Verrucomicrobiales bacterium]
MIGRLLGETIKVVITPTKDPLPIKADPGMIDQIIINLAVNARDAMPKGGTLTLSTRFKAVGEIEAEKDPDALSGNFMVLSIADTGEGMTLDLQKRVFEPFFTTKEVGKGTGLGLSTVYGIMKQHEGWIAVESQPGEGTHFEMYFPVEANLSSDDESKGDAGDTPPETATILMVEDELAVARMTSHTLQSLGYRVLAVENGPSARRVWQRHGDKIDLLLTDMVMPEGVSGMDLANEFASQRPELPVIFMSGYSEDLIKAEGNPHSNSQFLAKPFTRKKLVAMIKQSIEAETATV